MKTRIRHQLAAVFAATALACSTGALGATTTLSVALDTDNNPATGCSIATIEGPLGGFEQVLEISVATTTNTGQVGAITRSPCIGGVFAPATTVSAGGWPVGLGTGIDTSDVIEAAVPLAALGNVTAARVVAFTAADVLAGAVPVIVAPRPAAAPAHPIPALVPASLAALMALLAATGLLLRRYALRGGHALLAVAVLGIGFSTVGVAYAITRDGMIADWAGIAALGTDPRGDAPAGLDLVALYAVADGADLALRIDTQLARDIVVDGAPALAPVADRAIELGTRFQQLLVGSDVDANDTLTYALTAAPAGAALAPSPLVDWMPTASQLGVNTFTARVTDAAGHTATTTFHVTVVHTNHPPRLATQLGVTLPVGTPFNRTLTATDADAGDTLAFALVAGPPGMTATGPLLTWATAGTAPGDYAVTVRVTDAGGLVDTALFTITLQPPVPPPAAVDDHFSVRAGQVLAVPAPGVLGNDVGFGTPPLSAVKLTDPDKGTLSAFTADGGFTYQAPSVATAPPFAPVLRNHADLGDSSISAAVMIDLDGDGKPELVNYGFNHIILAIHADTGATLWRFSGSFFSGCTPYGGSAVFKLAAADIDDDGKPEVVVPMSCYGDNGTMRIVALNGQDGTVKWTSPALAAVPVIGDGTYLISPAVPTIARLHAGESPSVLVSVQGVGGNRIAIDGFGNPIVEPACRRLVENVPDGTYQPNPAFPPHYQQCRGVIVLDGADGTVRQRMIVNRGLAFDLADGGTEAGAMPAPIVVDLDGDGTPEIVAGGATFNLDGSIRWQGGPAAIFETAVGNFDDTPDIEVVRYERAQYGEQSLAVYKADGRLLWRLPFEPSTVVSKLSVGDIDGDGQADIVLNSGFGQICAIRHDGTYRWCYDSLIAGITRVNSSARHAIFDFDGDGVAEVVVQTTQAILFLDGATGTVKTTWPITQASTGSSLPPPPTQGTTYHPAAPLVGDVDADGHADLIFFWTGNDFSAPGRLTVLKGQANDWRPARGVQNQYAYHVANINDDGTLPAAVPLPNNFAMPRTNVFGTQAQVLAPVDPRVTEKTTFTYKARQDAQDSPPATVTIDLAPANRPPVFTSTPPTRYLRNAPFTYTAHATDPDVGDTVSYSILTETPTGGSCTIGAGSGALACAIVQYDNKVLVIAATDSQGERTLQTVLMTGVDHVDVVPNVVGQSTASAASILATAGFAVGAIAPLPSPAPIDQVLAQSPSAGASALAGEAVALSVSAGPVPVLVPFVVGQTLTLASTTLADLGFTIAVTPQFSATIAAGTVMDQSPAGGTQLVPIAANPVALTVSAGPPLTGTIVQVVVEPGTTVRLVGAHQQYKATAVFSDNTSADVTLAAVWSSSVPAVATVNAVGLAHATGGGATALSATIGSVTGQTTLNVVTAMPGDSVLPVASIATPADGAAVTDPVTVTGTASDPNFLRYELALAAAGDLDYTAIAEGTAPVTNGALGSFDPTTLVNDQYTLRLTVYDRGGNATVATSTVQASGNLKVGLYTLRFQDLSLPLAGIPISVTRTYDSRDKTRGDFGIGWRLGLQTLRLRANRVPGTGWLRTVSGPTVSLAPTSAHKVSLTLGDGRVEAFDLALSPTANIGSLDATTVTGYVARPGTVGKLQVLGNTNLLILSGATDDELVDDITLATYDPMRFIYTAVDGTQVEIDRAEGVQKVTDRNGNSLTFGAGGIIHSSGIGITFTRDAQQRITQITDPQGNVRSYVYDGNGDLARHIDAAGNATTFRYDRHHGLIDVVDPLGNHAVRNDYDADGRLVAVTDAAGQTVTFTHDLDAQEDVITDRRGNVTRVLYDARGNALSIGKTVTIEGTLVAATTTATYDGQDNLLARTDPDGLQSINSYSGVLKIAGAVDPAGLNLATAYAYNARNDVTAVVDPAGRSYAFSYDGNGNITGFISPAAGAATSTSNARGQAMGSADALGNRTQLTRDGAGNIVRDESFDAANVLLRRIDYTYDGIGNVTSQTLHRTIDGVPTPLTTQFAHDAANRLVAVTDAAGGVQRTEYDAAGRVIARVDALGRRTEIDYDVLGRPVRIRRADGTSTTTAYDVEGNVSATTDPAGRTTTFAYDELNRKVRSTAPDGGVTQTIYSPGGRVAAAIDANGNRTDYGYDSAGRLTTVTLPPVADGTTATLVRPQSARTLNAAGAATATTDANGHTTTFAYDAAGRPTTITFADGTSTTQTFDALGRRTRVTNEEGQQTTYAYDGLGRLIAVAGLSGSATYTYDEADNIITQTDALGRVTRFGYDTLNRLVRRQYPGGAVEQLAYDATGNVLAATDASGRTISLLNDALGRPTRKNLPGGAMVLFNYAADGQRTAVTDARGTTQYSYDSAGRLAAVVQPTGEALAYAHDQNGNLLSLAAPSASLTYTYDALNRLTSATAPEGVSGFYYDLAGNRVRTTAANGIVSDSTFDVRNRPLNLVHKTAANVTLAAYANAYSPAGRRLQVTEQDGSQENFAYDAMGRLASQVRSGSNPFTVTHAYDAVGNRTQSMRGGVPRAFAYNNDDQLLSDGTATYGYDAIGNLVSRTAGADVRTYGYDSESRLLSIAGAGISAQYAYDADGRRVQRVTPAGVTRFLVDGENNSGLTQVIEERDGAGVLQARYAYGDRLLAMNRSAAARYFLPDTKGSTRMLADTAGAVTDRYDYDAYGTTISATGGTDNPYRFDGERLDDESGHYQLRARYYDPALGRFSSRDPLPGRGESPVSTHRYLYANADPENFSDPSGLESLPELAVVQNINTTVETAGWISKLGAVCNATATLQQVEALIFMTDVGIQLALAGSQVLASSFATGKVDGVGKVSWGGKGELVLVDAENKGAKSGELEKVAASLSSGSGKFGFKVQTQRKDAAASESFEINGLPLAFKDGAKFAEKVELYKFGGCGGVVGEITAEPSLEGYIGGSLHGLSAGAKAGLDAKFKLFQGRFKATLPLLGIEVNSAKGLSITLGGVVFAH